MDIFIPFIVKAFHSCSGFGKEALIQKLNTVVSLERLLKRKDLITEMFVCIKNNALNTASSIENQHQVNRDAVTVGNFLGVFQLSNHWKLWPNCKDEKKMTKLPLFINLLIFFEVDFPASHLESKSHKAVVLIADQLEEKVKAAKRNAGDVKYVQFTNVQTGEGKTELAVFLSLTLPTYLDPSKIRIGKKRELVEDQLERVRPSTSHQTIFLLCQDNASKEQLIL